MFDLMGREVRLRVSGRCTVTGSTCGIGRRRAMTATILLLAMAVACGGAGDGDGGETAGGAGISITAERVDLTGSMYDRIEMGMGYGEVVEIVGSAPNDTAMVPDAMRATGEVLQCTWNGLEGSGEFPGESVLRVCFYEGEVCEREAGNL